MPAICRELGCVPGNAGGAYESAHFWMMAMTPLRRVSGNQYMHHRTERYRQQVRRKLAADRYVQLGCVVAQGCCST